MTSTRLPGIAAAAAVCLLAAGCGAAAHSSGTSAQPAGSPDPLASLTAKQIVTKALDNLKSAPGFTMTGTATVNGQPTTMSFGVADNGCIDTVSMGSKGTMTMIMIGQAMWTKGDAAFWKSSGLGSKYAGKYMKVSGGSAPAGTTCSKDQMMSGSSRVPLSTDVVKGALTTVNGQRVYPLTDKAKDVTMYVTDTSAPRFVEMVSQKKGDSARFTVAYGVPKSLTAPPASETTTMPGM